MIDSKEIKASVKVLFVCMGNICRSPTAHGVFQSVVDSHGLASRFQIDSAGTHSYHIGSPPDERSQATARSHGVDLSRQQARRFESGDFIEFDYVIAMDQSNLADMLAIQPEDATAAVKLMLDFSDKYEQREVPDPYFGEGGFEQVFEMIDDAARGLFDKIRQQKGI